MSPKDLWLECAAFKSQQHIMWVTKMKTFSHLLTHFSCKTAQICWLCVHFHLFKLFIKCIFEKGGRSSCWKAFFHGLHGFWTHWNFMRRTLLLAAPFKGHHILLCLFIFLLSHRLSVYPPSPHPWTFFFILFMDIYSYTRTPEVIAALLISNTCP